VWQGPRGSFWQRVQCKRVQRKHVECTSSVLPACITLQFTGGSLDPLPPAATVRAAGYDLKCTGALGGEVEATRPG